MADSNRIILLYGVIINQAMKSGDKELMRAVARVSDFMMDQVGGKDDDPDIREWYAAHRELKSALGD